MFVDVIYPLSSPLGIVLGKKPDIFVVSLIYMSNIFFLLVFEQILSVVISSYLINHYGLATKLCVCVYICIYIYIHMSIYIFICIHL